MFDKDRLCLLFSVYILNMVEAQRRPSSRVLQRLSGESFVVAVDEAEKVEAITYTDLPNICNQWLYSTFNIRQTILFTGLWCLNSLELAEDVGVLGWDAGGLQDGDSEGESAADLQVGQSFLRGEVQRKVQTQTWTLCWAVGSLEGG